MLHFLWVIVKISNPMDISAKARVFTPRSLLRGGLIRSQEPLNKFAISKLSGLEPFLGRDRSFWSPRGGGLGGYVTTITS